MRGRGFTLMEVVTALMVLSMVTMGAFALLVGGFQSFQKTTADTNLCATNANGLRYVAKMLHQATSVSVSSDGSTVTYQLPEISQYVDPVTGQYELVDPITPDGVNRKFTVSFSAGTLTDSTNGNVLVRNIFSNDPDPQSSTYNQSYKAFTLTTSGELPAITINMVTQTAAGEMQRYVRLKTTSIYHN